MIALVLGLFFLRVISCCTMDQIHLRHHHHATAGTVVAGMVVAGTVFVGETGVIIRCSIRNAARGPDRLWTRTLDGQDPLHLKVTLDVRAVERPPGCGPPPRHADFRIPYRAEPYKLCVLRI